MSLPTFPNGTTLLSDAVNIEAFFDLAQANRENSASGAVRIDSTGFDQRMQASRRMYSIHPSAVKLIRHVEDTEDMFMLKNFTRSEEDGGNVDPVRWYGLLAKKSLKDTQARFIQGQLPFED
jgi:hypothetical protein